MAATADKRSASHVAPRNPDRLIYGLWALFCAILIGVALRDYYNGGGQHWWKPVLWETSSMVFATVLLLIQRTAGQRYDQWLDEPVKWFWVQLRWLPLCVLAFIVIVYGTRHGIYAMVGERYSHEPWIYVIPYETVKISLFAGLWLGVIFSFDSYAQWQARQSRLLELQRALAESRLSALSAQLRPHFFFNALNTISALMHLDVARADRLLARLGDLLRASLQPNGQELVPLREELRLLDLYAQIMLERFADRVTLGWRVDDTALNAEVPALLMQPFLENAFKHAVERGRGKVRIEIAATRADRSLVLSVENTGSVLPSDYREGVGLRNCRERLQVLYGDSATAQLTGSTEGVTASMTLPWREHAA